MWWNDRDWIQIITLFLIFGLPFLSWIGKKLKAVMDQVNAQAQEARRTIAEVRRRQQAAMEQDPRQAWLDQAQGGLADRRRMAGAEEDIDAAFDELDAEALRESMGRPDAPSAHEARSSVLQHLSRVEEVARLREQVQDRIRNTRSGTTSMRDTSESTPLDDAYARKKRRTASTLTLPRNRKDLRNLMAWREVLSTPVSLREQEAGTAP